jgi:putative selenate reductase
MVELRPFPFGALVTRMFRKLERDGSIFHLPRSKFVLGSAGRDLSVTFHGRRAATPLGPAAGPQSQMAQNLVLSWLGGARILELKTVQVDDELTIPRPCIDMQTVGFNVEWSQELRLEQSLEEYVKGSMLIDMLVASGELALAPGFEATLFDMSVGYDLAGIRSERVQAFIRGMRDCGELVDRLRAEIPAEYARFRDLEFRRELSDTLTLSTFHGCPPREIEGIVDFLLRELGLHSIVKLNPMLLGPERTRHLLHDVLGYDDLRVPDSAFERDTRWDDMIGFVERLGATARERGLGFGVKLTNTLIVENHRAFFPAGQREMYLSGRPLHVLAMNLVRDFRARFGDRFPLSFSAGIERRNFPDAVALGLVPVTVCSDLLRPGGYARARGYFDELERRMDAVGARTINELVERAYGSVPERSLSEARLANTASYVEAVMRDPRYRREENEKVPRKIGSRLELFDCITCDKCVPVCPNDANFTFVVPRGETPIVKVRKRDGRFEAREEGSLVIEEKHQIASFADFCNECGNCDVFCPEDGGPYLVKPRFFGRLADWRAFAPLDGFCLDGPRIFGRFGGREVEADFSGERARYLGDGFDVTLSLEDPVGTLSGEASGEVDLTYVHILRWIRDAVYANGLEYPVLAYGARLDLPHN